VNQQIGWEDPLFRQTAYIVVFALVVACSCIYPFRNRNPNFVTAWASLKSWIFIAPLLFFVLGSPEPWPIVGLTCITLLGSKEFFQMTGMYHRSFFVWTTYAFNIFLAVSIYRSDTAIFNLYPMLLLGVIVTIPILLNQFKNMIQYMSLSLLNFCFLGWGFLLHTILIWKFAGGPLLVIYIILLTEFSDNIAIAYSRHFGKKHILENISNGRTFAGFFVSMALTLLLAWGLRHLLPIRNEEYWIASGLVASLVGGTGDLVLSIIRRDLGVRDTRAFIMGRGGFLDRLDRMIFVMPVFYFVLKFLQENPQVSGSIRGILQ